MRRQEDVRVEYEYHRALEALGHSTLWGLDSLPAKRVIFGACREGRHYLLLRPDVPRAELSRKAATL